MRTPIRVAPLMIQDITLSLIVPWLLMFGCGLTLKWADDMGDNFTPQRTTALIFGGVNALLCGWGLAWVSSRSEQWTILVFGIIVSVLVTGKVDTVLHWFGFLVVLVAWAGYGGFQHWMPFSWVWVLVVALGGVIDEVGHGVATTARVNVWVQKFFEYRWMLRVWAVILVVVGLLEWPVGVGMWLFDAGYLLGGEASSRLWKNPVGG